eukprot:TRINITY_DN6647_c0_g4_i1.p1 TRINITY_DN6647_c0_g4~~TRINITY_DN6647_c0_g4_i1.p1  ORF type:complete len:192 (+),score=88.22 TRINITY_DN6647_c0_g4_i1:77-652(+)
MKRKKGEETKYEVKLDQYGRKTWHIKVPDAPQPPTEEEQKPLERLEVKNLTARTEKLDLEKMIGKTALNSADAVRGFYCNTCEIQYNDSSAYLDHINSRKHYQKLGISMRVERAGIDKVKEKLKKAKAIERGEVANPTFADIEKKIEKEEEERRKKKKKVSEKELEEAIDFDAQEIVAFGLPGDFGTTKKK